MKNSTAYYKYGAIALAIVATASLGHIVDTNAADRTFDNSDIYTTSVNGPITASEHNGSARILTYDFNGYSTLTVDSSNGVTGATLNLNEFSTLTIGDINDATDATYAINRWESNDGSLHADTQIFMNDSSILNVKTGYKIKAASITLTEQARMRISAGSGATQPGLMDETELVFVATDGIYSGILYMNGNDVNIGGVSSIAGTTKGGKAGVIQNQERSLSGRAALSIYAAADREFQFGGLIQDGPGDIPNDPGSLRLNMEGTGTQVFTGSLIYSGDTNVNAGTLIILTDLPNSTVFVDDTGTLGGTGTFKKGITVYSGGTIAPGRSSNFHSGSSVGTMTTVDGPVFNALTMSPGSNLIIETQSDGTSDKIVSTGAVEINGANLLVNPGYIVNFLDNQYIYTIVDNDGTDPITGTGFSSVTENFLYFDATASINANDTNDAQVTLSRNANFAQDTQSITKNTFAKAVILDDLEQTGTHTDELSIALGAVLGAQSEEQVIAILNSLTGEIHASQQVASEALTAGFDNVLRGRGASFSGNNSATTFNYGDGSDATSDYGYWASGLGSTGRLDSDGNAAGLHYASGGIATGIETQRQLGDGQLVYGLGFGYQYQDTDVSGRSSSANTHAYSAGLYANYANGPFNLSGAVSYSYFDINTARTITAGSTWIAEADYGGYGVGLSGEASYGFELGGLTLAPLASLEAFWTGHGSTSETGAGGISLVLGSESYQTVNLGAGAMLSKQLALPNGTSATAQLRFAYEYNAGDTVASQTAANAGGGGQFTVLSAEQDRSRFRFGTNLEADVARNTSLHFRTDSTIASDGYTFSGNVGLTMQF